MRSAWVLGIVFSLSASGCFYSPENGGGKESAPPSIQVLSPNGGEVLKEGEIYSIQIALENASRGAVVFELYQNFQFMQEIPFTFDGYNYRWQVPSSLHAGGGYQVKALILGETPIAGVSYDKSDSFFEIASVPLGRVSIADISPIKGTYTPSETITFTFQGIGMDGLPTLHTNHFDGDASVYSGNVSVSENASRITQYLGDGMWLVSVPVPAVLGDYEIDVELSCFSESDCGADYVSGTGTYLTIPFSVTN